MAKTYEYLSKLIYTLYDEYYKKSVGEDSSAYRVSNQTPVEWVNNFLEIINSYGDEGWLIYTPHYMTGMGDAILMKRNPTTKVKYIYELKEYNDLFLEFFVKEFPDQDPARLGGAQSPETKNKNFITILNKYGDDGWFLTGAVGIGVSGTYFYIFAKEVYKS